MSDEFTTLIENGTWSLVPPQPYFNIIGHKWVFWLKRNPDGSIARYKARLVAKGFHQCRGIDFKETFSPVIKPQTIKLVLCIAISNHWTLSQMDVNNALLHGTLTEEVYISQPTGFVHPNFPHVCKMHKALYGLKQAPRAWYNELKSFLVAYGFFNSRFEPFLFIYKQGFVTAYFLVYVDDLLVIIPIFLSPLKVPWLSNSPSNTWGPQVTSLVLSYYRHNLVYSWHNIIIYVNYYRKLLWLMPSLFEHLCPLRALLSQHHRFTSLLIHHSPRCSLCCQ